MERQTDRQRGRHSDRQTYRQTDTKPLTFLRHHPDGPAVVGAVCERGSGGRQTRAHHRDVDRRARGQSLRAGQHCGGRGRGSVAVIKDSGAGLGVSGGHVDVQDPAVHLSFLPTETGSHCKDVCRRPGLHNYLPTETGLHSKDVCRRPGLHNYLATETGSHLKDVCRRPRLHNYLATETGSHLKDVCKRPGLHNDLVTETGAHFKAVCRRPRLHKRRQKQDRILKILQKARTT